MIRRVRTGCITCRRRRIKCDEGRPICDRCRTANFHCEGYEDARRTSNPSLRSRSSSRRDASSPPERMVAELPWRQANWRQEQLPLYHHFVTSTVVRLFRVDHVRFWRDQVAQMSVRIFSPCISCAPYSSYSLLPTPLLPSLPTFDDPEKAKLTPKSSSLASILCMKLFWLLVQRIVHPFSPALAPTFKKLRG